MRKKESAVEFSQESSEKNPKNCGKRKWKSNKLEEERRIIRKSKKKMRRSGRK